MAVGRTVARYFEKIVTHDVTLEWQKLRVMIFSKIIPLSPAVLSRYRNSELLNRLVADVDTLDVPLFAAVCTVRQCSFDDCFYRH